MTRARQNEINVDCGNRAVVSTLFMAISQLKMKYFVL